MKINKAKRIGVVLILLGLFIPSVLYPFTTLTPEAARLQLVAISRGVSMDIRLADLEIEFRKERKVVAREKDLSRVSTEELIKSIEEGREPYITEPRVAMPYGYAMAIGVVLVFAGVGVIVLSSKRLKE